MYVARRNLIDGLCGTTVALTGIDGKQLSVPVETIVDAGSTKVVSGEGMARRAEKGGGRGDLLVVFDLVFPKTLSRQREMMRAAFSSREKPFQGGAKSGDRVPARRERRRQGVVDGGEVRRRMRVASRAGCFSKKKIE